MIRSIYWSTSHMTFWSGILSVFNILKISKTPYLDSWITVLLVIAVNTETVTKRLLTRRRRKKNTPHTIHRESKRTANCKYKEGACRVNETVVHIQILYIIKESKTNWRRERDTTLISRFQSSLINRKKRTVQIFWMSFSIIRYFIYFNYSEYSARVGYNNNF